MNNIPMEMILMKIRKSVIFSHSKGVTVEMSLSNESPLLKMVMERMLGMLIFQYH